MAMLRHRYGSPTAFAVSCLGKETNKIVKILGFSLSMSIHQKKSSGKGTANSNVIPIPLRPNKSNQYQKRLLIPSLLISYMAPHSLRESIFIFM